jgi:DNA-binding transcriptional MerR regulator
VAARGRKPWVEELRLREQIANLHYKGMGPAAIRDALASLQNTTRVELSIRQVQAYLQSMRARWAESVDPAQREAERAEIVAQLKDASYTAAGASARHREDPVGVGYLKTSLKAIELRAKYLGLDERAPSAAGASTEADAHPFESLPHDEQPAELRRLAEIIEETP